MPAPTPLSPTLAANEAMEARRRAGLPVLPMGFGQADLPVHPELARRLADAARLSAYGPVARAWELREAAAGYWQRRNLATTADQVVCGPGSKPLLYGLISILDGEVALSSPSWVSYVAQVALARNGLCLCRYAVSKEAFRSVASCRRNSTITHERRRNSQRCRDASR